MVRLHPFSPSGTVAVWTKQCTRVTGDGLSIGSAPEETATFTLAARAIRSDDHCFIRKRKSFLRHSRLTDAGLPLALMSQDALRSMCGLSPTLVGRAGRSRGRVAPSRCGRVTAVSCSIAQQKMN